MRVAGSGNVSCGPGHIDSLITSIAGSGSLDAREITARTAQFTVSGSADITVGRVIEKSVEKLSRNCKLKVLARGE